MELNINEIKENPKNPRKTYDEVDLKLLAENMQTKGQLVPLIVDENNVLLSGHRRLRAAKQLGWTKLRIERKEGLTNFGKSAVILAANTTQKDFNAWEHRQAISDIYWNEFLEEYEPVNAKDKGYTEFSKRIGLSLGYVKQIVDSFKEKNQKIIKQAKDLDIDTTTLRTIINSREEEKEELLQVAADVKQNKIGKNSRTRAFVRAAKRKISLRNCETLNKHTSLHLIRRFEAIAFELSDDLLNKMDEADLNKFKDVLQPIVDFHSKI